MDFLTEIKEETLVLCNAFSKQKILEFLGLQVSLKPIKIMTITEFLNHFFFSYNNKTIYYIRKKYHLSYKNAILNLEHIKYAINSNLEDSKIIFLKTLYEDLKNQNLLILDPYFKESLKNLKMIVLEPDSLDPFTLSLLKSYKATYIPLKKENKRNSFLYSFATTEEECEFVFNEISDLIKTGESIENIKVCILGEEYIPFFKRFSYLYHIPFTKLEHNSILSCVETKEFLEGIREKKKEDLFFYYQEKNSNLALFFLNIINEYYFVEDLNLVYEEIYEKLKNTYLDDKDIGIEMVSFENLSWYNDKFVFLLGFNLENIPKTYKDIDYFNDSLKEKLGLFTSIKKNRYAHDKAIETINSLSNLSISYKNTDPYGSYYKSNLIEELELKEEVITTENTTSSLYNKMKLTMYFDQMLKYGSKHPKIPLLYSTYKDISYLTYSNKYTKIKEDLSEITLSYTSINNYYHCAFRYYIDSILKLNQFEETFSLRIGTLFHFVLSKMYEKDFSFEEVWNEGLKKFSYNKKEQFYLKELKEELKDIIEVLKYQLKLTGLTKVKLEEQISLKYGEDTFTGIIDKIMFKEKDGNTYLTIIDYKTGTPKINMTNLKYGLDMQLPVYVYLVKKSNLFLNPKVIGFYLEQILFEKGTYDSKKTEEEQRIEKLKLNGYSIEDPYLVSMFDESYEESQMIKGMKITSKGFGPYAKVLSEDAMDNLVDIVDSKVQEAFSSIREKDFSINPKVINGENIGCSYCKYKDLCFKSGEDLVYLKEEKDLSYL